MKLMITHSKPYLCYLLQLKVVKLILFGFRSCLTNKEISGRLGISFDTVNNHLQHIYEKLHVCCRAEAVMKYFHGNGIVKPSNTVSANFASA